jgi:hypothetical protein
MNPDIENEERPASQGDRVLDLTAQAAAAVNAATALAAANNYDALNIEQEEGEETELTQAEIARAASEAKEHKQVAKFLSGKVLHQKSTTGRPDYLSLAQTLRSMGELQHPSSRDLFFKGIMNQSEIIHTKTFLLLIQDSFKGATLAESSFSRLAEIFENRMHNENVGKNSLRPSSDLKQELINELTKAIIPSITTDAPEPLLVEMVAKALELFVPLKDLLEKDPSFAKSILPDLKAQLLKTNPSHKHAQSHTAFAEHMNARMFNHLQSTIDNYARDPVGTMQMLLIDYVKKMALAVAQFNVFPRSDQSGTTAGYKSHLANQLAAEQKELKNQPRVGDKRPGGDAPRPQGKQNKSNNGQPKPGKSTTEAKPKCAKCGHGHKGSGQACIWVDNKHPDVNDSNLPWHKSEAGKKAKAAGLNELQWGVTIDNHPWPMESRKDLNGSAPSTGNHDTSCLLTHLTKLTTDSNRLTLHIPVTNRQGQRQRRKVRTALIDTGAIDATYIGTSLANSLVRTYGFRVEPNCTIVHTPDNGAKPFYSQGQLTLDIEVLNELKNEWEMINVTALVINSPLDLIIGLPDIRKYDLLTKCKMQILSIASEMEIDDDEPTPPVSTRQTDTDRPEPNISKYKSQFAASLSSWSSSSSSRDSQSTQAKQCYTYNCRSCCTLVAQPNPLDSIPVFGLGLHRKLSASHPRIGPRVENSFLCTACTETESLKIIRNPTLRNHLEDDLKVEDLEVEIQGLISMLQQNPIENPTIVSPDTEEDPMCTTNASRPKRAWAGLCSALSSQHSSQQRVDRHIQSLPADQLIGKIPMEKLLGPTPDMDDDPTAWLNNPNEDPAYTTKEEILTSGEWDEVTIEGSPSESAKLKQLVHEHRLAFSSKLPLQPCRVTPLLFHVDTEEWQQSSNRLSARRQTLHKDLAIKTMTNELCTKNVISPSKATAWSQVHLTPKPPPSKDPWRFCIDFRRLNNSLTNTGWPLPRIRELLTRIGDAKPKYFGKFDLTNGYHQMPLAKESQAYTAFVTPSGLYEWQRVPMGIKQAAGYFQREMQLILGDLIYQGVELYIDDIIIYAETFDEYMRLTNLVLSRLKERGIVISPRKSYLGMTELEILGHTVNAEGVSFSRKKLQAVLDFPTPKTTTQLQSFLGLTTYFRDHVKDMTNLERPLRDMLKAKQNAKHAALSWNADTTKAFKTLQEAVWNCATLYFYDSSLPVFLLTDACNTGIGAYLFQVDKDGKEYPVGFMSQALHGAQLRWSTFEQEAFAIHEALKKFQYLLRDIQFTLKTDHRNLLYLNDTGASDKVLRWKLDIQQFNFNVEHIPGQDNIVADLYSRLCTMRNGPKSTVSSEDWIDQNMEAEWQEIDWENTAEKKTCSPARSLAMLATTTTTRRVTTKPHTENVEKMTPKAKEIIEKFHGKLVGHGGVERTIKMIKDRITPSEWWPTMRKDVRTHIHECAACQFMQPSKMLIATTAPYNMSVRAPMDRLNIDTIGPLPEDANGNKYIIVIIDVFSRYVELYPSPDGTAIQAARCMIHWISHYGIPGEILTDNGTQYTATIIDQLCELLQLDHLTIAPYSHQENAIVERANREVNRILRAIVFDMKVKNEWSLYLPLVSRVINSSKHLSTGCAPASILFGNSVDLNRGFLPDKARLTQAEGNPPLNEYLSKLLNIQSRIVALAEETQYTTSAEHIQRKTNKGDTPYDLKVGDWVMYHIPNTFTATDTRPDKLAMHYKGPYLVAKIEGSSFTLRNVATNTLFTANQAHVSPFNYDAEHIDPAVIQRNVEQEYLVEAVLQHKGSRRPNNQFYKANFLVKIRWAGQGIESDSWEPYENIKNTEKFHEYCVENKLNYLLTKEAQQELKQKKK